MIIETAFFNTCLAVIDTSISEKTNEEHLRGLMLQKFYEQFQLNYWDTKGVLPQCKYDLNKIKLCDLKIKFPELIQMQYKPYGIFETNWIEIKYLKEWNEKKIVNDLLRLCLLPKELQGKIKENGRYFMLVKNSYIKNKEDDLRRVFQPGYHENIKIEDKNKNYLLSLNAYTYEFIPIYKPQITNCFFSGYLVKILGFTFSTFDKKLNVTTEAESRFSEQDVKTQKELAKEIDSFCNK